MVLFGEQAGRYSLLLRAKGTEVARSVGSDGWVERKSVTDSANSRALYGFMYPPTVSFMGMANILEYW